MGSGSASYRTELLCDRFTRSTRFDIGDANALEPALVSRNDLYLGLANPEQVGNELDTLRIRAAANRRSGHADGKSIAVTSGDR